MAGAAGPQLPTPVGPSIDDLMSRLCKVHGWVRHGHRNGLESIGLCSPITPTLRERCHTLS